MCGRRYVTRRDSTTSGRTFASAAAANGVSEQVIGKLLGHKDIKSTASVCPFDGRRGSTGGGLGLGKPGEHDAGSMMTGRGRARAVQARPWRLRARIYVLSQVFDYGNTDLEKRAIFYKHLMRLLDFGQEREGLNVPKIERTHYALHYKGVTKPSFVVGETPPLRRSPKPARGPCRPRRRPSWPRSSSV